MNCCETFLLRTTHGSTDQYDDCSNDCACPADGLAAPNKTAEVEELPHQCVRLFLQPVDTEFFVGYSPFVPVGRFC
jgi:hypothetical protein